MRALAQNPDGSFELVIPSRHMNNVPFDLADASRIRVEKRGPSVAIIFSPPYDDDDEDKKAYYEGNMFSEPGVKKRDKDLSLFLARVE